MEKARSPNLRLHTLDLHASGLGANVSLEGVNDIGNIFLAVRQIVADDSLYQLSRSFKYFRLWSAAESGSCVSSHPNSMPR